MREYYTVDRSPRELKDLWDWATKECRGKIEHESRSVIPTQIYS